MAIKAVPVEVVAIQLLQSDPDGETTFWMRPATGRDDLLRGELLKNRAFASDMTYGAVTKIEVNIQELRMEELWILYDHAECVLITGPDPEKDKEEPFKERKLMTKVEFFAAYYRLPADARAELWSETIAQCSPGWRFPL